MSKRNFSIGITINLDNYENLRLDVGGEIENERDAEELIGFLDRILSRLGRGTKETAQRVDSYRSRVFALQKAEGAPEQQAPPKREPPQEKAPAAAPPAAAAPKRIPEPPAPSAPAAARPPETAVQSPSPAGAPPSAEFVCEECQAPVSKGQNQMSQLFTGRTLCKKCMKAP